MDVDSYWNPPGLVRPLGDEGIGAAEAGAVVLPGPLPAPVPPPSVARRGRALLLMALLFALGVWGTVVVAVAARGGDGVARGADGDGVALALLAAGADGDGVALALLAAGADGDGIALALLAAGADGDAARSSAAVADCGADGEREGEVSWRYTEKVTTALRAAGQAVQKCDTRLDRLIANLGKVEGVTTPLRKVAKKLKEILETIKRLLTRIDTVIPLLAMIPKVGPVIKLVFNVLKKLVPILLAISKVVTAIIGVLDEVTTNSKELFERSADFTDPTASFLTFAADVLDVAGHTCMQNFPIEKANKEHWESTEAVLGTLEESGNTCDTMLKPLDDTLEEIFNMRQLFDPVNAIMEALEPIVKWIEAAIKDIEEEIKQSNLAECVIGLGSKAGIAASLVMCPAGEAVNQFIKPGLNTMIELLNQIISVFTEKLGDMIKNVIPNEVLTIPDVTILLQYEPIPCCSVDVGNLKNTPLGLPYSINFQEAALSTVNAAIPEKITYTIENACEQALASLKEEIKGCGAGLKDILKEAEKLGKVAGRGYDETVKLAKVGLDEGAKGAESLGNDAVSGGANVANTLVSGGTDVGNTIVSGVGNIFSGGWP